MAKLILSMDGLVLKEIPLAKERTTIGRKPTTTSRSTTSAVSGGARRHRHEPERLVPRGPRQHQRHAGERQRQVKKHFPCRTTTSSSSGNVHSLKFSRRGARPPPRGRRPTSRMTMVLRPSAMKAAASRQGDGAPRRRRGAQPRPLARAPLRAGRGQTATAGVADKDTQPAPARARRRPAPPPPAPAPKPPSRWARSSCFRAQRRQGARAEQAAHHARQARRAGGGADAPPQGYFITHVEGAAARRERPADRRRAARAQGSRRDRARRREDGILLKA
jgi:hypothetical protein